jgi:hypothetical protein
MVSLSGLTRTIPVFMVCIFNCYDAKRRENAAIGMPSKTKSLSI